MPMTEGDLPVGHTAANGFWHPGKQENCERTPCDVEGPERPLRCNACGSTAPHHLAEVVRSGKCVV